MEREMLKCNVFAHIFIVTESSKMYFLRYFWFDLNERFFLILQLKAHGTKVSNMSINYAFV